MADLSRVLVVGSTGRVGHAINFGIKLSHAELDVTSQEQLRKVCDHHKPSAILNLAMVDLRASQLDPVKAYKVNALGAYNTAEVAAERKIPIVLVSTGAIFNGTLEESFGEHSLPNPQNVYGSAKYAAELLVQKTNPKHIIVRTGWLYGGSPQKGSFIDAMIGKVRQNDTITATYDQKGSPTYMVDFVHRLSELIRAEAYGLHHAINTGSASALEIMEYAKEFFKSDSVIEQASAKTFNPSGIIRSPSEVLTSKTPLRPWKDALHAHLTHLKQ